MKTRRDKRQRQEELKALMFGAKTFYVAKDMESAWMYTDMALAFSPNNVEALTNKGALLANGDTFQVL